SIMVAYHAMPRWMHQLDVFFDDSDVSFRRNLHAYRVACGQYLDEVRTHFKLLKSLLMGKAVLKEISRTKKTRQNRPVLEFPETKCGYDALERRQRDHRRCGRLDRRDRERGSGLARCGGKTRDRHWSRNEC